MTLETDDLQEHSSEASAADRLTSWKEIAAYLKCSESTVRRWEDEGMPVHRHPHKKRSAIYAYKAEIDAWWNDGHARLAELARTHVEQRRTRLRWLVAASAALLLLLTGTYLARQRSMPRVELTSGRAMLAVLPFQNLTGDPSQDYFIDGLTEEMITDVGRLNPGRLGVIARTSVMRYKNTHEDVQRIGHILGVDYVLEGAVRRQHDQVRITAQLIQVRDQTHLWAQSYDRELHDVLAVENDVARNVADEIRIELTPRAVEANRDSEGTDARTATRVDRAGPSLGL